MNNDTKTCPYCAEPIPGAAKVCPRCRQWLTLWSTRNPNMTIFIFGLPFAIVLLVFVAIVIARVDRIVNPRPFYTDVAQPLHIVRSEMHFTQSFTESRIQLLGVVTNQSSIVWKDPLFECRFFNGDGKLIDVAHMHDYYTTILPNNDCAFSLRARPNRDTNEYSSYQLTVTTATSGNSRW
jgi:predicted nucleic acid-binding Zn ribbon protein